MVTSRRTKVREDKGTTPYERLYSMKPDVGHICTFGCVVRVTPGQSGSYGLPDVMGYKYDGGYCVWIPHIRARESRD